MSWVRWVRAGGERTYVEAVDEPGVALEGDPVSGWSVGAVKVYRVSTHISDVETFRTVDRSIFWEHGIIANRETHSQRRLSTREG